MYCRLDQLEEVILERLALHTRKLGLLDVLFALLLEPVQVRQARLRESGELVDALPQVGDSVVRVEIDEVLQLAINDPFDRRVAVFELDAEDRVPVVERVDGIGDAQLCARCTRSVGDLDERRSSRDGLR